MPRALLQEMIEDLRLEDLPAAWNSLDIRRFSANKSLWDYQQAALENALKVLWKYFEEALDYREGEGAEEASHRRKQAFFRWYRDNGLDADLSINLRHENRALCELLAEYYPCEEGDSPKISYEHFINRMCFWMATGSGKTLILIKLIEILHTLIRRRELPPYDFLILTHRDDLIRQLKRHVEEFNYTSETKINLRELKDYPEIKRQQSFLGTTVLYYRSDNLSDAQKEKIVDFRNYDNQGQWYIFLDEAHRGDREDSKLQHIYSILSRNGFLFNFSATFTDIRDITTTAYNFNLEKFIQRGYGKHIAILKQEMRAFRDGEDYTGEEKQKIVLQSLILLTYVKKFYEEITSLQPGLYHNPLMLVLTNSVNVRDSDLELFFRELTRIGQGAMAQDVFERAKDELWEELKEEPPFMFEAGERLRIDEKVLKSITKEDILRYVYNAQGCGEIEVLKRPSNKQELAFKLKTSERPFALIKIGDVAGWLQDKLAGYEVQESFTDESYFENLNKSNSDINILMGSRSFYEGWDSNRPNVICYINIGGQDARKFILQSLGRGVRLEPIKTKRRRLLSLYNGREVEKDLFERVKTKVLPVETLFVLATNRKALVEVISRLGELEEKKSKTRVALDINPNYDPTINKLLVPVYKQGNHPLEGRSRVTKPEVAEEDYNLLRKWVDYIRDDRVFLMRYNLEPRRLKLLRDLAGDPANFSLGGKNLKNPDLLVERLCAYFSIVPQEIDRLKELEEEIRHFNHIEVDLQDFSELQAKIARVKDYPRKKREWEKELARLSEGLRQQVESMLEQEGRETFEHNHQKISIRYVSHHYYIPLLLSEEERVDYLKHIIKTKSEVQFVNELERYLSRSSNKFQQFDWWMFSKIDETLDAVYLPYYDPASNRIRQFYPDFIFWLRKGNDYFILFVDPKGTEHTSAYRKIEGYRQLFEERGEAKTFFYDGYKVKVKLLLKPQDAATALSEYQRYWFDNIEQMLPSY